MRSLNNWLHPNRLQIKVVALVIVIMVVPMIITGVISFEWVSARVDASVKNWLQESARINIDWLHGLYRDGKLFADMLKDTRHNDWLVDANHPLISKRIEPLVHELGVSYVEVYDLKNHLVYATSPITTDWRPPTGEGAGQDQDIIRVTRNGQRLLAAVTVTQIPRQGSPIYRVVIGVVFDKLLLQKVGLLSGLKTRLFYPNGDEFAKAFAEDESAPLRLRLSSEAMERLQHGKEWFSAEAKDELIGGYIPHC